MAREINQAGIDLVKQFEGFYADAYICPAGVLTIGYGHTGDVLEDQCIDEIAAETLLRADLHSACASVERLVNVPLSDNQFAALASFAFNCGAGNLAASTLLKKLNHGNYDAAPAELARWVKATDPATGKKRPLAGLVRRRSAEAELWLTPDGTDPVRISEAMPQKVELTDDENRHRVIARSGLRMRGGPGREFEVITTLPVDTEVTIRQRHLDWVEVDRDGNGLVDGWVFSTYLAMVG
jgi:lysozyme